MSDRLVELRAILDGVRRRWARRAWLRAWTLGAVTSAAVLLVGLLAVALIATDGLPLVVAAAIVTGFAIVSLVFALLPLRRLPDDKQMARFIEERAGGLDDVLVTAVERAEALRLRSGPATEGLADPMSALLAADAVRAAATVDLDRIVTADTIRHAMFGAVAGSVALLVAAILFAPSASRATHVVGTYLFPARYAIDVSPGSIKLRAGDPLTIVARIAGLDGGIVPVITVGLGADARAARMSAGRNPGEFTIALNNINASFPYTVTAGAARSADYLVTVIRPVRVERIDLRYEYPAAIGLAPQTETDSGDIYAPAGTRVTLSVTTDKPITTGHVKMADGRSLVLAGPDRVLTTDLTIEKDGSYRIALQDVDGLASAGDTEYFVRVLDDRPPDVRILRPAGDKQVSPLEEVEVAAKAEDDYGIQTLDLVFKTAAGKETVVPLGGATRRLSATGQHTLFLEDLKVQPGDFVAYYARARDVARGRQSVEARSDIFFLEVKPYDAEFTAAQSQTMGGGMQGQSDDIDTLIAAQKDIIAATWKLDARSRKGKAVQSAEDVQVVARGQRALKSKTEQAAAQLARTGLDPRRRRGQPGMGPADDPVLAAIAAMGKAATELERSNTATALPHEMDALNQLMRAAAEVRRRQIQRMQAQGGGGNGNRQTPDLSTLFDQELRKQQQTNYETPNSAESRDDNQKKEADPLDGIRELARRQEALARAQKELDKQRNEMTEEELTRQLERLTRDQNELRQQADDLSQQLQRQAQQSREQQQNAPGQRGGQRQGGQPSNHGQAASGESQKLREIADEMKNAAGDLRKQDPKQAGSRGDRAAQQLRELEQQMQGSRPDERRRALGDLQLEARQLADAERRLGSESQRTAPGPAGEDARRKLAAEQDRLADRTDRLGKSVSQLSKAGADADTESDEQQAMAEAARDMDREKIGERMRQTAQSMRQGQPAGAENGMGKPDDLAKALEKVAEKLGAATGARDSETERLSSTLARTQELRDKLSELQRQMDELAKSGPPGQQGPPGQPGKASAGDGQVARLQREIDDQMRQAQQMADDLRKQNPGMQKGGSTPEEWQRSVSAPGTESFKQDFAKWESLKKNLVMALEQTETQLSQQLRARENKERLNAGRRDAVSDSYRELVDRYYQSLAAPRRPQR